MQKYFFNVTADMQKVPDDLKAFFSYTVGKEATDDLTRDIDSMIKSHRTNEAWRNEYMYFNLFEQDAKEAGREEGRAEERAKTAQALLERDEAREKYDSAVTEKDNAIAEVERLKNLLRENGIKA